MSDAEIDAVMDALGQGPGNKRRAAPEAGDESEQQGRASAPIKKSRLAAYMQDEAEQSDHGAGLHDESDGEDGGSVDTYEAEGIDKREGVDGDSSEDDDDSDSDSVVPGAGNLRRKRVFVPDEADMQLVRENLGQAPEQPELLGVDRYAELERDIDDVDSEGMDEFIEGEYAGGKRMVDRMGGDLTADQAQNLDEVFGHYLETLSGTGSAPRTEVANALSEVYGPVPVRAPKAPSAAIAGTQAPAVLSRQGKLLPSDDTLLATDVPERLYMRLAKRRRDLLHYVNLSSSLGVDLDMKFGVERPEVVVGSDGSLTLPNRDALVQPDEGNREEESNWIAHQLLFKLDAEYNLGALEGAANLFYSRYYKHVFEVAPADGVDAHVHNREVYARALLECVSYVLRMVLDSRLEVPTVFQYRRDFLLPILDQRLLWDVLDQDELYWRVRCQTCNIASTVSVYERVVNQARLTIKEDQESGRRDQQLLDADDNAAEQLAKELAACKHTLLSGPEVVDDQEAWLADSRQLAYTTLQRTRAKSRVNGSSTVSSAIEQLAEQQRALDLMTPEERAGRPDVLPVLSVANAGKFDRYMHAVSTGVASLTHRLLPQQDLLLQRYKGETTAELDADMGTLLEFDSTRDLPLEAALAVLAEQTGLSMPDAQKLLVSAAAYELGTNNSARAIMRRIVSDCGCVSTECTPSGFQELDSTHELYGLHVLRNKRVSAFASMQPPRYPTTSINEAHDLVHNANVKLLRSMGLEDMSTTDVVTDALREAMQVPPEYNAGEYPALGTSFCDSGLDRAGLNCGYGAGAWFHRVILPQANASLVDEPSDVPSERIGFARHGVTAMEQAADRLSLYYPQRHAVVAGRVSSRVGGPAQWILLEKGEREGLLKIVMTVQERASERALTADTRLRDVFDDFDMAAVPAMQLLPYVMTLSGLRVLDPEAAITKDGVVFDVRKLASSVLENKRYDPANPSSTLSLADTLRMDACLEACRRYLVPAEIRRQRYQLRKAGITSVVEEYACELRAQVAMAGLVRQRTPRCEALAEVFARVEVGHDDVPEYERTCSILALAYATADHAELAWAMVHRDGRVGAAGLLDRSPRKRQLQLAELIFTHAPDAVSIAAEGGPRARFLRREVDFASVDAALLVMQARKSWAKSVALRRRETAEVDVTGAQAVRPVQEDSEEEYLPGGASAPAGAGAGEEDDENVFDLSAMKRGMKSRVRSGGSAAPAARSEFARGVFAESGALSHLSGVAKKWAAGAWKVRAPRHAQFVFELPEWKEPPTGSQADERFLAGRNFVPFSLSGRHANGDGLFARLYDSVGGSIPFAVWAAPALAQWARNAGDAASALRLPHAGAAAPAFLGLYTQNPLAAWACLWPLVRDSGARQAMEHGVASAPARQVLPQLHPLQSEVPAEQLLRAAERVLTEAVAAVGVDVNKCLRHSHFMPMLQFVPGLGPRRALALQARVRRAITEPGHAMGSVISRLHLSLMADLPPSVDTNAMGVLRVVDTHLLRWLHAEVDSVLKLFDNDLIDGHGAADRTGKFAADQQYLIANPLDATRIHPDSYLLAASQLIEIDAENTQIDSLRNDTFSKTVATYFGGLDKVPTPDPTCPATYYHLACLVMRTCRSSFRFWLRHRTRGTLGHEQLAELEFIEVDKQNMSVPEQLYQPGIFPDASSKRWMPEDGALAVLTEQHTHAAELALRQIVQDDSDDLLNAYYLCDEVTGERDSTPFRPVPGLAAGGRAEHLRQQICNELWQPARDVRYPWERPSAAALMHMLTSNVPVPGERVQLTVTRADAYRLIAETSGGLRVTLNAEDLGNAVLDNGPLHAQFERGQRLVATCVQVEPEEFAATVSLRSEPLTTFCPPMPRLDRSASGAVARLLEANAFAAGAQAARRIARGQTQVHVFSSKALKRRFTQRHISHPNFMNATRSQVQKVLETQPLFSAMLRPHGDETNKLSLVWKWRDKSYAHYIVTESGPSVDAYGEYGLGSHLHFKGQVFDSIDELIGRGIGAMTQYAIAAESHKSARVVPTVQVDDLLREAFDQSKGARAAYILHPSDKQPGFLCISSIFQQAQKHDPQRDMISIRPDGYRWENQTFTSIRDLVKYWKAFKPVRMKEQRLLRAEAQPEAEYDKAEATASATHRDMQGGAGYQAPGVGGYAKQPGQGYGEPTGEDNIWGAVANASEGASQNWQAAAGTQPLSTHGEQAPDWKSDTWGSVAQASSAGASTSGATWGAPAASQNWDSLG